MRKKLLSILALLCLTGTSAWAQEETLLTTIVNTGDNAGFTSGSKTFDNIATVTFSGNVVNDNDDWGWYSYEERTLTVTAAEGYTITRVKFYNDSGSGFDEEAPFEAILVYDDVIGSIAKVNGTSIDSWGVNKIEVYGYASTTEPEPDNTCGNGVTWALNNGVLTISGTGAMDDFGYGAPWTSQSGSITSLVIENGVTRIGTWAFYEYTNLATVSIPSSVTSIGYSAFSGCSGLATINIPEGVTSIESSAFSNCTSLTSVNIPASVTTIQSTAFYHCTSLASVTLNSSPYFGTRAFTIDYGNTPPATFTMNLTAHEGETGEYWTTLYNNQYNFQVDENTEVFKVDLSGTELTLNKVEDGIVTNNTAVVLKTTGGSPVLTQTSSSSSDAQSNSLIGVANSNGQGTTTNGTYYVLNKGSKGVGFYKLASGNSVGNGKAYLTYSAGAREFFLFDEATGIESIDHSPLTIDHSVYDLQGRRVAQPTKGLYIVNGKKVIINK